MMSIKTCTSSLALENYLNKKAKKGYLLQTMVPFSLFPPFILTAFRFQKTKNKDRTYRIDKRNVPKNDKGEYLQLFKDDGWTQFTGDSTHENSQYVFYSDTPHKTDIFSDIDSQKNRNKNDAVQSLLQGFFLICSFILLSILFPIPYHKTWIGFISHNFYIIVAIVILIVSLIRYRKNR